jgi:hypothetical protein
VQKVFTRTSDWLERIDPGTHRRVKGLRLVTAYGGALALGRLHDVTVLVPGHPALATLAAGFALWASVSEARCTRPESSRDLALLCLAAALGAAFFALLSPVLDFPLLQKYRLGGGEWILLSGAFLAGWLRAYGILGTGVGSQIYIGELLAYNARLAPNDLHEIGVALVIAVVAAVIPRLLSGPAEQPVAPVRSVVPPAGRRVSAECIMGLQSSGAAAVVVVLNSLFGLIEPAWAITACVYGVTVTTAGTVSRLWRRIVGTLIGVPLGLVCLPIAEHWPLMISAAIALALIVYAIALPDRYDIACGAFAFVLITTLAATGHHSIAMLVSRAWETLLGGGLAIVMAVFVLPLRAPLSEPPASADLSRDSGDTR